MICNLQVLNFVESVHDKMAMNQQLIKYFFVRRRAKGRKEEIKIISKPAKQKIKFFQMVIHGDRLICL